MKVCVRAVKVLQAPNEGKRLQIHRDFRIIGTSIRAKYNESRRYVNVRVEFSSSNMLLVFAKIS